METKTCSRCKEAKPLSDFGRWKYGKDGLQRWCKECNRSYQTERWFDPSALESNRKHGRERQRTGAALSGRLRRKFGIDLEEFKRMEADQGGLCAICRRPPSHSRQRLSVDHCHKTGKVRGLLCGKCNLAIGMADDHPEILVEAALYLERHNQPAPVAA